MNWLNTTVGDMYFLKYGKALSKQDQYASGTPVYGSNGVYTFTDKSLAGPYVVIVGRKGSVGKVHLSKTPCWVSDTAFYLEFNSISEAYYSYYLLLTLGLENMNTDAAVPGLNRDNAHRLEINLPNCPQQRANLIKPLIDVDEKILLNKQINQTLEEMAQAIFKSWFVDFDPVKAKAQVIAQGGSEQDANLAAMQIISGKTRDQLATLEHTHPEQYTQLHTTASLFPSAFVDSELGEIPEGWEVKDLNFLCDLNPESWTSKTLPATVNYLDLANVKQGDITNIQILSGSDIPSRARRILRPGDTIFGTVRPNNRSFSFVGEHGFTGSTGFAVLRPKKIDFTSLIYHLTTCEKNIERLTQVADGGAYPAVRPELVAEFNFACPKDDLIAEFHKKTFNALEFRSLNRHQREILAAIRDTLLPKLLSGEIDV